MLRRLVKPRWFIGLNAGYEFFHVNREKLGTEVTRSLESDMVQKLREMKVSHISNGIKKCVKNGFITKKMFDCYNDLIRKNKNSFTLKDIILLLQSYALCKERNFEIYSLLSSRLLYLLKAKKIEYTTTTYEHMYRYIIASSELNYSDFEVMCVLLQHIKENVQYFELKKIAKVLHAQSKLKIYDEELLEVSKVYILNNFEKIKTTHINHLIAAYSKSEKKKKHSYLLYKLMQYVYQNVHSFDSISLYNILLNLKYIIYLVTEQHYHSEYIDGEKEEKSKYTENRNKTEVESLKKENQMDDSCYLNSTGKEKSELSMPSEQTLTKKKKDFIAELPHILFTKVNNCLAFLSFYQLINVVCAYKDLNYFNYNLIYKRLLHFLLAKAQSHKITLEQGVFLLEFFSILPFVDSTVEQIINIVVENVERNFVFQYAFVCRLLVCFKKLNINSDDVLSKIDNYIFTNKKSFEKQCTYEELGLFLSFFKNGEEWMEICTYLTSLKTTLYAQEKKNLDEDSQTNNETSMQQKNDSISTDKNSETTLGSVDRKLITYTYDIRNKCFREQEFNLNDESMEKKELGIKGTSESDKIKQISNYLYFNAMNENKKKEFDK